jgi:hypothetical protein
VISKATHADKARLSQGEKKRELPEDRRLMLWPTKAQDSVHGFTKHHFQVVAPELAFIFIRYSGKRYAYKIFSEEPTIAQFGCRLEMKSTYFQGCFTLITIVEFK